MLKLIAGIVLAAVIFSLGYYKGLKDSEDTWND